MSIKKYLCILYVVDDCRGTFKFVSSFPHPMITFRINSKCKAARLFLWHDQGESVCKLVPLSSLKVSSILFCSDEFPPVNSVLSSRSSSSSWSSSFCSDFLNQGPLSWSERRSGIGNRTTSTNRGAFIDTETWQCAGVRLSSRKTSAKALCLWGKHNNHNKMQSDIKVKESKLSRGR